MSIIEEEEQRVWQLTIEDTHVWALINEIDQTMKLIRRWNCLTSGRDAEWAAAATDRTGRRTALGMCSCCVWAARVCGARSCSGRWSTRRSSARTAGRWRRRSRRFQRAKTRSAEWCNAELVCGWCSGRSRREIRRRSTPVSRRTGFLEAERNRIRTIGWLLRETNEMTRQLTCVEKELKKELLIFLANAIVHLQRRANWLASTSFFD